MVLSQPPISTTASSGSAVIISSTSIAIRLRSSIEVGNENASCSETVGNTNGSAPAMPHAARDRFGDLRRGLVAGVEVGGGGEDADDRPVERLVGEARALEEAAPQEQRELLVAVLGEAGPQAFFHGNSPELTRSGRAPPLLRIVEPGVSTEKGVARPEGDETGRADRTARGKGGFSRRSLGSGG